MPKKQDPPQKRKATAKPERDAAERYRQPKTANASPQSAGGFEMSANQPQSQSSGLQDRELQERMANADLVVVGKVSAIKAMPESVPRGPISHKNPALQMATIDVESVEKGSLSEKRVDVVYASSRDIRWHRSWKPELGQHGIWFLQKPKQQELPMLGAELAQAPATYSALKPGAYQPTSQLDRVRSLKQ